ncbi:MAG: hypothetical protein R6U29_02870 [Desulfosudaceae bacterium]
MRHDVKGYHHDYPVQIEQGLTSVLGDVSDHGGQVKVQSRAGQGTSFILYFPVWRQTDEDV